MGVAVVEVDDGKEQGLVEEFGPAEQIFLEDAEDEFGPSALLDHVLSLDQFAFVLLVGVDIAAVGFVVVTVVLGVPLVYC